MRLLASATRSRSSRTTWTLISTWVQCCMHRANWTRPSRPVEVFGSMVAFMTVGSLLNARFAPRFGASRILRSAAFIPAIAGIASAILGWIEARTGAIGMWPFFFVIAPQIASISLIGPNSAVMALHRYPHMAGTASSLMGVMQFGIGAIFGAVVGQTFDGTIAPMTTAMGIAGILCLLSNRLLVRDG